MKIEPRISVVMPVHGNGVHLGEAISSILTQSFDDFELIIVSEIGTSQESIDLIDGVCDERVRHFVNKQRLGLAQSLNLGLKEARGEFVARMDADDVSEPLRFERQVRYLEGHPNVGIIGAGAAVIDERGGFIRRHAFSEDDLPTGWRLFFFNSIAHPTVMARLDILRQLGGYNPEAEFCEDYDLWLRATETTMVENMPEMLLRYRVHELSVTQLNPKSQTENARRAAARALTRLLGREVSLDLVGTIRLESGFAVTPRTVIPTFLTLVEVYRRFRLRHNVPRQNRANMRRDISLRLSYLAVRSMGENPVASGWVWSLALLLSPRTAILGVARHYSSSRKYHD